MVRYARGCALDWPNHTPLSAVRLAIVTELIIISEIACICYVCWRVVGEIAPAYSYVAIAASSVGCVPRMRNGNLK